MDTGRELSMCSFCTMREADLNAIRTPKITGKDVKILRKELNLSQREGAYQIGVSPSFLNKIENWQKPPTDKVLRWYERKEKLTNP